MRRAGTNAPVGANYNKAFGLWLDEHQWARELDKATRNILFGPPKIVARSSAGARR
jgi:hypothetical protein